MFTLGAMYVWNEQKYAFKDPRRCCGAQKFHVEPLRILFHVR